jgi:toxin ParE1/3/4
MKDIHRYIMADNSKSVADDVIRNIKGLMNSLKDLPNRGNRVRELEQIGFQQYRELHYNPYRIIYSVEDDTVFIHIVLDSRRDIQSILLSSLIRP